jgi:hypothetical protein
MRLNISRDCEALEELIEGLSPEDLLEPAF